MSNDSNPVNRPIMAPTREMVLQTLAEASAKLSSVEMRVILQFASFMYEEQVRYFSDVEADIVENLYRENKQEGLRLPKEERSQMMREMNARAVARTVSAFTGE